MTDCPDLVCTRRRLLALAGATAGVAALDVAAPNMAFGAETGDLLVVVTLGGGADGLSLVPPLHDPGYQAARPAVAVQPGQALGLDRTFGLHPGLKPLLPYWKSKQLAIVHAVGDSDGTRSHFEATDAMERGVSIANRTSTGWIDRHLTSRGLSSFPALSIGGRTPGSLRGPAPDLSTWNVRNVRLSVPEAQQAATRSALAAMYADLSGPVGGAGRQTLSALQSFARFRTEKDTLTGNYPNDHLGSSLKQVAQVARARVGLQVACVGGGGWDTHEAMGSGASGYLHDHIGRLGQALAAFAHDLGPLLARTTIVTVSEFGRRVAQNGSGGVDHGHGSAWLVLGGGIRGGRVYGRWPGLGAKEIDDGDLRVTTDYRDVLGELVHRRLGGGSMREVFPGHRVRELGIARQR